MRSMSEFMEAMVEAGLKKFDTSNVEPDETNRELREQRNELKGELTEPVRELAIWRRQSTTASGEKSRNTLLRIRERPTTKLSNT